MITILATRGDKVLIGEPVERLADLLAEAGVHVWVSLSGDIGEPELTILRDVFKFHPLSIEDCIADREQPKIDEYDGYLYINTHGIRAGGTAEEMDVVETDAFIGPGYLVTYHNKPSRSIEAAKDLVGRTGGPLRRGSIALYHAIIDRQVDDFEPALHQIEDRIAEVEDAIFGRPQDAHLESMLAIRRNILQLRRWMAKEREVVMRLARGDLPMVKKAEALHFRDVHDHLARFTDTLDNARELVASMVEVYVSVTSNRLNEVMRFFAALTGILMPLTLVTGIYGMNFDFMPELRHHYGYPITLLSMAALAGGSLLYFRHRGWLGRPPEFAPAEKLPTAPAKPAPAPVPVKPV